MLFIFKRSGAHGNWHSFCKFTTVKTKVKEAGMLALKQNNTALFALSFPHSKLHTTLYDMVEAVSEVIGPGEERLVGMVVRQMMSDYNARFASDGGYGRPKTKGTNPHMYLCWRSS
jgi:hypothetical protein